MEFPADEEYMKMVAALADIGGLGLCCGNCGAFALALQKLFGVGILVAIENDGFDHVLLEYEGKYYDGEGIYYSYAELKRSRWGNYIESDDSNFIDDVEEAYNTWDFYALCNIMADNTFYDNTADSFVPIIQSNCRARR